MFNEYLPLTDKFFITEIISGPEATITIKMQSRKALTSDDPNVKQNILDLNFNNAWRYIIAHDAHKLFPHMSEDNALLLNTFIGPIINVKRNTLLKVYWQNHIPKDSGANMGCMPVNPNPVVAYNLDLLETPPINPIPMSYANSDMSAMNPSIGVVPHLHGGKLNQDSDGWPTSPFSFPGNPYYSETGAKLYSHSLTGQPYYYYNQQRAAMLWFHDHGMDNTAPQVHAGLAGLYFIRDDSDDHLNSLLNDYNFSQHHVAADSSILLQEIPLVIQDRVIDCDYCCFDYWGGIPTASAMGVGVNDGKNTPVLKRVRPEFLGETIFVNSRPWPHFKIPQRTCRLRLVNGSNARTYALALVNPTPWTSVNQAVNTQIGYSHLFTVIGNEAGLFAQSYTPEPLGYILLAPGERLDVLLDVSTLCPDDVPKLRVVNLAVKSLLNPGDATEGIYQTSSDSIFTLDNTPGNLKTLLAVKQANIMQFCLEHNDGQSCQCSENTVVLQANKTQFTSALNDYLLAYARDPNNQEGFVYDNSDSKHPILLPEPTKQPVKNRLIILMNNAGNNLNNTFTADQTDWRDTQIWEMLDPNDPRILNDPKYANTQNFKLALDVDLRTDGVTGPLHPSAASPTDAGTYKEYKVSRHDFFAAGAKLIAVNGNTHYAPLDTPTIVAKSGTYERWYVANLGSWQPVSGITIGNQPDMHPFHTHLVNFVAQRRFSFDYDPKTNNAVFNQLAGAPDFYDQNVRHDTLRIESNQLVELLVYFPEDPANPGRYTGEYPYHCHLVEHEDMGMMLHFKVEA